MVIFRHIDMKQWNDLTQKSSTASWFQTPQAYSFYEEVADELTPFAYAVLSDEKLELKGVCVGYIVPEVDTHFPSFTNVYRYFTSRAIILGGPMLADDITDDQLCELLSTLNSQLSTTIYIETRNFNDYSRWKAVFEKCGFAYQPHYNYIQNPVTIASDIDRNRRRNIEQSEQNGLLVAEGTASDIKDFYALLFNLYRHQLHIPVFSRHFFEQLVNQPDAKLLVAKYKGKIVGGELCVALQDKVLYDWYGCGINTLKHVHPSEYITYKTIEWARDNKIERFDFMGAGSPDKTYGVRDFKARFGGQLVEYGRFLCVNAASRYKLGKTIVGILNSKILNKHT